jgi:Calx-beta domain/Secretion system C-terminal sorting domain
MKTLSLQLPAKCFALFAMLVISSQQFAQAPANDDCSGAILISTIPYNDLTTSYTNANTNGATRSTPDPSCITSSDNNDDIWYKFVASTQTELLRVHSAVAGSIYTTFGYALYDTCGGTELKCNNQLGTFYANELLGGLTPGKTYYLRFWSLHNFTFMTFSFAVMDINPTVPGNDAANATQLTINDPGVKCISPQFFSTAGATRSSPNPSCSSDNDDDVWFQFICPANGVYIYIEKGALISSSAPANMGMEITDASSGLTASCILSSVVGSSTLFSGAAGGVYRIRLWTVGTTDRAVFSICLQNGFGVFPANDTCAAATLLTVGTGACTNPVTGNLFNSNITPSLTTNPTCTVNTTLKNDVWYKAIVPASGNLVVQTSATNSQVNDLVMLAYTNNCSTFTQIACDEDGNTAPFPSANHPRISLTGRTPGETILYRVMPRNGNNLGQFSICAFDETAASLPTVSINNASFKEGNSGTKLMNFTVSLSNASTDTVRVRYKTMDSTAVAPTDYAKVEKALTFRPGLTIKTVSITVNGDTLVESNEKFKVKLFQPFNVIIADSIGIGTIKNDDTSFAFASNISEATVTKTNSSIKIYPNPVTDVLHLDLVYNKNVDVISVIDITGRIIKQTKTVPGQKNISVNTGNLSSGIYLLKIQSGKENTCVKFIKQ